MSKYKATIKLDTYFATYEKYKKEFEAEFVPDEEDEKTLIEMVKKYIQK